jgi:hypothetical protein
LETQFNTLQERLEGKSEKEIQDFLSTSAKDPAFNELASGGFLFGILADPQNAAKVILWPTFFHKKLKDSLIFSISRTWEWASPTDGTRSS